MKTVHLKFVIDNPQSTIVGGEGGDLTLQALDFFPGFEQLTRGFLQLLSLLLERSSQAVHARVDMRVISREAGRSTRRLFVQGQGVLSCEAWELQQWCSSLSHVGLHFDA